MSHADECGHCKEIESQRIAAAKRDLAVKVLATINDLPIIINRRGIRKGGDLNGWYSAQQEAIEELKRLFTTEGISLSPLTARKEKEGLSGSQSGTL